MVNRLVNFNQVQKRLELNELWSVFRRNGHKMQQKEPAECITTKLLDLVTFPGCLELPIKRHQSKLFDEQLIRNFTVTLGNPM